MKCLKCDYETFRSLGEQDICPNCGYGSKHYRPLQVIMANDSPELCAYREAGHAVMSYLIRKGFTDKYVPIGRSLILPAFEQVAIESESANWAEITHGLGSLVTVPQVLLAGYVALQIKYNIHEEISLRDSPLVKRAWHLLGAYLEEYGEDNPSARDERATEWLQEIAGYVEEKLRAHWVSVEALATALLEFKVLAEDKAFEIIEKDIPKDARAQANIIAGRTIEENLAAIRKERDK